MAKQEIHYTLDHIFRKGAKLVFFDPDYIHIEIGASSYYFGAKVTKKKIRGSDGVVRTMTILSYDGWEQGFDIGKQEPQQ